MLRLDIPGNKLRLGTLLQYERNKQYITMHNALQLANDSATIVEEES